MYDTAEMSRNYVKSNPSFSVYFCACSIHNHLGEKKLRLLLSDTGEGAVAVAAMRTVVLPARRPVVVLPRPRAFRGVFYAMRPR